MIQHLPQRLDLGLSFFYSGLECPYPTDHNFGVRMPLAWLAINPTVATADLISDSEPVVVVHTNHGG